MAHDSRTGCSVGSGRSVGLASGSGRLAGRLVSDRLAFWARLALVVLLGLLAGLGVAWVSARRPEWRPVAVFALVGSAGLVLLVRRYWPQWLWRYTGFVLLGLGWLTVRRWGVFLGWEVFLASAMLYGLGLGVWDAVRERQGCGVGCFARSPDGCGPECGMRGKRYVSDARAAGSVNYCAKCLAGEACGCDGQPSTDSEQVSTSPDNRNASVAELAEAEHRLRVSRRRLELLRPLSEESNRITDEILRLYKLSDEELLREVGLPTCDTHLASLIGSVEPVKPTGPWLLSPEPRPAIRQHKPSGEPVVHFDSDGQQRQLAERLVECFYGLTVEERRKLLASWPTLDRSTQPIQNSDENPSELDATAGPNVSGQLDLPFGDAAQQRQQIQAALRQGDQDIAANHGHDLGEVLADLDGKPSQAQPPAWQKPILARLDDFQAPPRSPIVSSPATKPAT